MNNFNLKCENLKQSIINIINESHLPISSVYYIMELLKLDLEKQYYAILNQESLSTEESNTENIEES